MMVYFYRQQRYQVCSALRGCICTYW